MTMASPVSNHGGKMVTVASPAGITSFSWKWPKTTWVKPSSRRRLAKASICSSGSRVLCLKFERESRFSTLSTNLRAVRFGISFRENFEIGFFEASRQKRYG